MPASQFQSFEEATSPATGGPRLAALRAELTRRGLAGFVVPRADEHQGEYVPPFAQRLAWLTGFTGSAGLSVVLADKAAVFIDGRYTVQVKVQTDPAHYTPVDLALTESWIAENLPAGAALGFDPWLHTADGVTMLARAVAQADGQLVAVSSNPVDAVWPDQPARPTAKVSLHPLEFAGLQAADKLAQVQAALAKIRCQALVVSDPHSVAWLFNIRGGDVSHTPLPLAYAIVPAEGRATLFIAGAKLDETVRSALAPLTDQREPEEMVDFLKLLAATGARIRLDQATGAYALKQIIESAGGTGDVGPDPIALMKAVKNRVEQEGSRSAHRRDGVAMARFLAWFEEQAPTGRLTEIDAVEVLEDFRRETNALAEISFPSISGAGPNAALPHYRVSRSSNRQIGDGIFLIDSGGQYQDGTTDITRTIAVGTPSAEMRDRFTRVLQGHIAIATAVFPKGTSGAQLDSFARRPLWEAGMDFDHGTGHGVGSFLSVHEGPQRLAKTGTTPLEAGMILSNEPGYYKEGAYGIRIENLILVVEKQIPGAERPMLGFETLTFTPIDLALVEPALMTAAEIRWLNDYHAEVRRLIAPGLDPATLAWLTHATRPIGN
jgi:Xaa-Pro aminopeptidase